jgi:hypothetical protein
MIFAITSGDGSLMVDKLIEAPHDAPRPDFAVDQRWQHGARRSFSQ